MIEKSVTTLEEAKIKYEELVVKLKRLETLEPTLKKDIDSYKFKVKTINDEIVNKLTDIGKAKDFLRKDAERMKNQMAYLKQNKDNYNKLLTTLILKTRTKNAQLEDNDIYKRLRELEKKMQANENTIFSLQSYIDSRSGEGQFGKILKECMDLQEQINNELLKKYH